MFILDPHSGVPIYRQLCEQIRRLASSGQLAAGTELPSIRDFAVKYAVNPMTVSKAYSLLHAEGVLERHRGKPMTVATPSRKQATAPKRLQQLAPHVDRLVLAARQLELSEQAVHDELYRRWEKANV